MGADPSLDVVGIRGGVASDGAAEVDGGIAEQFFGLGPRFMCGDAKGAAVAGATTVDMTAEAASAREVSGVVPKSQVEYFSEVTSSSRSL